jgi:hypothetical protein
MKTNSQILKLIPTNPITRHKLNLPLLFMFFSLFVLSGCKKDNISSSKTILSLKEDITLNSVVTCPTFEDDGCVLPDCKTNNSNNCTRQDLDPCDYADMLEYAEAVACELNKFINGCPYYEQQFGEGCVKHTDCVALNSVSATMASLEADFNPWVYCSTSNCSTFVCSGGLYPNQHKPISIIYQNAMMTEARRIILSLFENSCECPVQIGRLDFYVCNNPSVSCSSSTPCFNSRIHVKVEYWCCPTCY